jgi:hypothetical protein
MGGVLTAVFGYVILVCFLAIVLQLMGGKRSAAGGITIAILIGAPLFIVALVLMVVADTLAGIWDTFHGDRFHWVGTRWLAGLLRGPGPTRQIKPSELRTLGQLVMLTPTEFELAVGDLMNEMGFRRVKRIGGSGDLAVDLTARDPSGQSVAVQCKRYATTATVGSPEIQKFIGMTTTHHMTDRAIFVTTASYTKPATDLAQRHKIELWDGSELARMLEAYRGDRADAKETPGFAALDKADAKLTRKEARDAARAAAAAAEESRYRYEHTSSFGIHIPDAALDLARESAAARALRRLHADRDPTEEEIDDLVRQGSPVQPSKSCDDCGATMEWYEQLPGHYCVRCARIELWIADERKILNPRSKKRTRRLTRR